MASLRENFGDLLEPGLRKLFDDKYAEIPEVYSKVFTVSSSEHDVERDSAVSGFGLLTQTPEGGAITYEDPVQMYDNSYVHLKYTKGFKVSEELYEDDRYSVINKKPQALARSARRTTEFLAASVFNNAFTSGTGGDSKYLLSTLHPRADGGTAQSNASSTGVALSEASLNTGLLAMRSQLDDKGMPIQAKASILLVPPELEMTAQILTKSQLRSGTANNDYNPFQGVVTVISWDWLTSSTAWFLLDGSLNELNWFWRVRPEFKQDSAFDTGYALYKTRMRCSVGWSDWRGVWGSEGDATSYAL